MSQSLFVQIRSAYWAGVYLIFLGLTIFLDQLVRRNELDDGPGIVLTAVVTANELVFLAFLFLLAFVSSLGIRSAASVISVRNITLFALTWALLLFYFSSWGLMQIAGGFLNYEGLRLFVNDSYQVIQHASHMSGYTVLGVIAGTSLVSYLLVFLYPKRLDGWSNYFQRSIVNTAVICVFVSVALVLYGVSVISTTAEYEETGMHGSETVKYDSFRKRKATSGPVSGIITSALSAFMRSRKLQVQVDLQEDNLRPIISMGSYIEQIDRGALQRKNVIVLLIESLRSDQLPAFGGERNVMPALQSLAERSVIFTNTYAQSSHSNYADLVPLSSHYPLRSSDVHFYPENPGYPRVLIYDILHAIGYRTAIFSSQNENWGGMLNYLDTGNLDTIFHAEDYFGELVENELEYKINLNELMLGGRKSGKLDDGVTMGKAISWINENRDEPFFIYMNLQSSHFPYEVPENFQRRFSSDGATGAVSIGPGVVEFESEQALKDRYADSLYYIDTQIRRLLDMLEETGLIDETIVVVSSDTATAFHEHGIVGNGYDLYNETVKVPLIFYGHPQGAGKYTGLTQHLDIPPTLLDILGLPIHPSFQGDSMFSDLSGKDGRVYLVCQTPMTEQYAIVSGNWKLIKNATQRNIMLYDLSNDPGELTTVAVGNKQRVKDLLVELDAWIAMQLYYYSNKELYRSYYPPRY